jgi:3-deoxy-D-manno-octulosonic-acid transferase
MAAYGGLVEATVWGGLVPGLILAGRRGEIPERLGHTRVLPKNGHRRLVLHAVSAGEMRACAPLVARVLDDDPDAEVVLCTATRDGRAVAEQLRASSRRILAPRYLPWDRPARMRRWLAAIDADAVVVVETELWPGLFAACRTLDVPLLLVSARLYPRDVAWYAATRAFWEWVLSAPRAVLVQDAAEHAAFHRIGAPADRLVIGGNLKFDAALSGTPAAREPDGVPVIVGASTHHPEEQVLLDAIARLHDGGTPCKLILAPRRVGRAAGLRSLAARRSIAVTVLDRMGTLGAAYAGASAVFVGGTIAPRGGHDIIEPASLGLPCVVGPHVGHIRRTIDALDACGGVVRLPRAGDSAAALGAALAEVLIGRRGAAIGAAAKAYCRERRGAADRAAAAVRSAWRPTFATATAGKPAGLASWN